MQSSLHVVRNYSESALSSITCQTSINSPSNSLFAFLPVILLQPASPSTVAPFHPKKSDVRVLAKGVPESHRDAIGKPSGPASSIDVRDVGRVENNSQPKVNRISRPVIMDVAFAYGRLARVFTHVEPCVVLEAQFDAGLLCRCYISPLCLG